MFRCPCIFFLVHVFHLWCNVFRHSFIIAKSHGYVPLFVYNFLVHIFETWDKKTVFGCLFLTFKLSEYALVGSIRAMFIFLWRAYRQSKGTLLVVEINVVFLVTVDLYASIGSCCGRHKFCFARARLNCTSEIPFLFVSPPM